ncbi:Cytochrome c oxidase subunit CcoN [hydrothermal vent metagenome]|uniref:Cytochrome c oxidase subunit CcoN n=1 Tax=hydrothermal vent metagenome TaxID=652676 RepID=A0A1W1EIS7_9ZZZZ
MFNFEDFIKQHFYIGIGIFGIGLFFGIIYSLNLLGLVIDSSLLNPSYIRSIHISLMLYGFIPLMLSLLPFLLIYQDIGLSSKVLELLQKYFILWYIFLLFMVMTLLFGVNRGLAFYDFHYSLNFILAFAGLFYILALYKAIKGYIILPLWIKVSLVVVTLAPIILLFLMNPVVGQVEATISGPHGDNTLGMSFALIPIYYLVIKYLSGGKFIARWHTLWIIPFIFYIISIIYRASISELSYDAEWFFQWLTLLYIPLLYRWYQDAIIDDKRLLLISIVAFLFVDIEGNILFIESIRWIFHRNNLIIAHAHIAMGVGVMFLMLSLYAKFIPKLLCKKFLYYYLGGMIGILISLSIVGFVEANLIKLDIPTLWIIRTISGLVLFASLIIFIKFNFNFTKINLYNLGGVLADGVGGVLLILFGEFIYKLVGFSFVGVYQYIVFGFVIGTGIIHIMGLIYPNNGYIFAKLTMIIRFLISSIFLALFLSNQLGIEGLGIAMFDLFYGFIFLFGFYRLSNNW